MAGVKYNFTVIGCTGEKYCLTVEECGRCEKQCGRCEYVLLGKGVARVNKCSTMEGWGSREILFYCYRV